MPLSYEAQQESFPGPVFKPTRRITQQEKRSWNLKNATTNAPARETTRQVLAELDIEYKEVYGKRNLTIAKEIRMNCGHKGQLQLVRVQIMIHHQTPVFPLPAGFCWDVVPGSPLQIFLCLVTQITATLLTIWQVLLCIYKCPEN